MWICKECGNEVVGWESKVVTSNHKVKKNKQKYKGKVKENFNIQTHECSCGFECVECGVTTDMDVDVIANWDKTK